jgi:hypothetical protein
MPQWLGLHCLALKTTRVTLPLTSAEFAGDHRFSCIEHGSLALLS